MTLCHDDYEYDHVDAVPPALECPICRSALVDPVQTPTCDHLFCRACLEKSLSLNPSCPIDRTRLDSVQACSTPHRAILYLLAELRVNYNGRTVTRDEADRLARNAAARPEPAAATETATTTPPPPTAMNDSSDGDDDSPTACDYCTLVLPRSTHPTHLLTTCAVVPLPCPHARRGCPYSGPRALLEQDHLPSECVYEPIRAYLDRTDEVHARLEGDNWELGAKVATLERTVSALVAAVRGLQASLGEFAPVAALPLCPAGGSIASARGDASGSMTGRPRPAKRAASSPSTSTPTRDTPLPLPSREAAPVASSPRVAAPTATASSPLSSTLSHLESTQSHLSSSVSTLLQSHSHSLATTRAVQEELASLRTQLTGVRIQMGGVMRDVYGAGYGSGGAAVGRRMRGAAGSGGGAGAMGGYGGGTGTGGRLGSQVPALRPHPGLGSSGSSDEDLLGHHHHHAGGTTIPLSSPSSYEDDEEEDETEFYHHHPHPYSTSRSAPGPARPGHGQPHQFPFWNANTAGFAPGTAVPLPMPMPFPNGMRPIVPGHFHPAGPGMMSVGGGVGGVGGGGGGGNGLVKL
ncbi:hypothetical protein BMF94_1278 [Rhodotorula taiwanensis]|uniref:RING-type domain-containing protein n=1 Tax=Rhodotorula taiwanensis TaxID=741276 RepID=A0A2S5BFV5_9BASI|nr:hypothetical protein BMF94_1278 [Rhodotorula taiwanensis]